MSRSVWIDIDNPPQVQYLLPFKAPFEARGFEVVVTARDYGITLELLRGRGIAHHAVGGEVVGGRVRKAGAALRRARTLGRLFGRSDRPDIVLTASRAAALAGRRFGTPTFTLIDYEHVDLKVPRVTGSYVLHPEAIGREVFEAKGFARDRLIGFVGLKEGITFSDVDLQAIAPFDLGPAATGAPRLLFRPPAERAHYYAGRATDLTTAMLEQLAARHDVQVVLAPRYDHQIAYVERLDWVQPPIVLRHPAPFAPLLLAIDAVMSSGGTMLREAAYLGIPAYSIFRSEIGAVDRYLETAGRLRIVEQAGELEQIAFEAAGPVAPVFAPGRELVDGLVDEMVARS
jgi:predicted glycosyltransferase